MQIIALCIAGVRHCHLFLFTIGCLQQTSVLVYNTEAKPQYLCTILRQNFSTCVQYWSKTSVPYWGKTSALVYNTEATSQYLCTILRSNLSACVQYWGQTSVLVYNIEADLPKMQHNLRSVFAQWKVAAQSKKEEEEVKHHHLFTMLRQNLRTSIQYWGKTSPLV